MKKQRKTVKLVLAKETLRNLEKATLNNVVGGSPTDNFWSCRVCDWEPVSERGC